MNFVVLTPSSLIIHENDKISKVPQRYHENHFKLKIARNIVQYLIERLHNPLNLNFRRIDIIIINN